MPKKLNTDIISVIRTLYVQYKNGLELAIGVIDMRIEIRKIAIGVRMTFRGRTCFHLFCGDTGDFGLDIARISWEPWQLEHLAAGP